MPRGLAPLFCTYGLDTAAVDPASIIALLGLGGAGVGALWKIANGLGRFEARTTTIMAGISKMLEDHEDRIRTIERSL